MHFGPQHPGEACQQGSRQDHKDRLQDSQEKKIDVEHCLHPLKCWSRLEELPEPG